MKSTNHYCGVPMVFLWFGVPPWPWNPSWTTPLWRRPQRGEERREVAAAEMGCEARLATSGHIKRWNSPEKKMRFHGDDKTIW